MKHPSWIGKTLGGRYRIEQLLGQGGMSAVFKAYDPNLKRVVAVKLIHPHLADDPKFLIRFEEEATAVAKLRHSNIAQVYDYNHDGDVYFMVQEYVPGETLQERLRRLNRSGKRIQIAEVIQYTVDICNAAGYAHRVGMIHRDIKPANIILDVHDQAILMDFGIVKILGGEQHTATGAVVGTALYLPPELIRGEVPDPRSDVYSLGITLYEMVSGRPPFEADSAMTLMMMHLHDTVPDLRQLRPGVPDELIGVIEKALRKDRHERYGSMAEMATALKTAQQLIQFPPAIEATQVDESIPAKSAADVETLFAGNRIPPDTVVTSSQASEVVQPTHLEGEPIREKKPPQVIEAEKKPSPSLIPTAVDLIENTHNEAATLVDSHSHFDPRSSQIDPQVQPPPEQSSQSISSRLSSDFTDHSLTEKASRSASKDKKALYWIGGFVLVVIFIGIALIGSQNFGGGDGSTPTGVVLPTNTSQPVAVLAISTDTPTPTIAPPTPTITVTSPPAQTPTPTLSPTPTIPVGIPYSRILDITIRDQSYVVEYETFEYTEALPGMHVHFFFNTVPPEQAGSPGVGPWYVWGGPRPFDRARQTERPDLATQMCILVANPDHSVQFDTGNCYTLPDIVAVVTGINLTCKAGPSPDYADAAPLPAGEILLARGISPDESWWNVVNPLDPSDTCWLPLVDTVVSGDISSLPLVQPPELISAPGKFIEITQIDLNAEGRYVVEYEITGFTEQLPGTHIHFFFNTTPPEQVGISGTGSRLMYGGPSPFTGYRAIDRPAQASEICALVANPDHSIIFNSGNCVKLPDM